MLDIVNHGGQSFALSFNLSCVDKPWGWNSRLQFECQFDLTVGLAKSVISIRYKYTWSSIKLLSVSEDDKSTLSKTFI